MPKLFSLQLFSSLNRCESFVSRSPQLIAKELVKRRDPTNGNWFFTAISPLIDSAIKIQTDKEWGIVIDFNKFQGLVDVYTQWDAYR